MIAIFNSMPVVLERMWRRYQRVESDCKGPGTPIRPRPHCGESALNRELELIVHARGKADFTTTAPRRIARAAVVDDLRIRAIVTVRREPAPSRADIVMRIAFVDRIRRVEIPVNVLVEAVLPRNGVHVRRIVATRRIVIALAARISRSRPGVSPADADVVFDRKILRERHPEAVPLPLVLELQHGRYLALHVLVDAADRESEWERILDTGFERRFVADIGQIRRRVAVAGGRDPREFRSDKVVR